MKSKKLTAVFALIMDLPLSLIVTVVALLLAGNLNAQALGLNFVIAYVLTFFINFMPSGKWGAQLAMKHAKPDTLKFGLIVNGVISLVFTVILDIVMAGIGVLVIAGQSFNVFLISAAASFIPCYIAAFIVAFITHPFADKLSREICHEPEQTHA